MTFTANNINGKLVVKLLNVNDALVHVYKMPKNFNKKYKYHGFFENGYELRNQVSGSKFEAPSDWVIHLQYHIGYFDGNINVATWVEDYSESDIPKIKKEWQPTGTKYINQTKLALEEEARIKEEKRKADILAKKLKAAKDKRIRDRILAEAKRKKEYLEKKEKLKQERLQLARIKIQQMAAADKKVFTVTMAKVDPEGLYFNREIIIFMVSIGLGLFILGICITGCFCKCK